MIPDPPQDQKTLRAAELRLSWSRGRCGDILNDALEPAGYDNMPHPSESPPTNRPTLVYDGDFAFCRAAVDRSCTAVGEQIEFAPYQAAAPRFPEVDAKEFGRAVHFVDADRHVSRGAEAVFRAASHCGRKRWLLWLYTHLAPLAVAAELVYRLVAANRTPIAKVLHVWRGRELKPPTYHVATALFLRLLGLVYLIAFVSLWTQIDGLVGDQGILPASSYLDAVKLHCTQSRPPLSPVWQVPTLAWISPHDAFLNLLSPRARSSPACSSSACCRFRRWFCSGSATCRCFTSDKTS